MGNEVFEKKFEEAVSARRHRQLLDALETFSKLLPIVKTQDPELKNLIEKNSEAINNFSQKVGQLSEVKPPEVNVEVNNDKVVTAINEIFKELIPILRGIDERLTKLEQRPLPTKLKPVRDGFLGTINYVIVEYQK